MSNPLPRDWDAEEYVLGACMISEKAADRMVELLRPEMFDRESHGRILQAVAALRAEGKPAEAVLVVAALEQMGKLKDAGGAARVHELAMVVPASANAPHFAERVREMWVKRTLSTALVRANHEALNGRPSDEAIAHAESALLEVRTLADRGRQSSITTGTRYVSTVRDRLGSPRGPEDGVPAPFSFLRPLVAGRLYELAGYTGDGKSSIMIQFAHSALRAGRKVGLCTLEMTTEDLGDRWLTSFGIPYSQVYSGRVSSEYRAVLGNALEQLDTDRLHIIDDPDLTLPSLSRYQHVGKYDLLIIDHLHEFAWDDRRDFEKIVKGIRSLAIRARVPILLLAQLSRGRPEHPFPKPTLRQLRESGMIEASAASVWFVWRERDDDHQAISRSWFITAKNRYGPLGQWPLHFRDEEVRFVEIERSGR